MERSDRDRHLSLQADCLACGGQGLLNESIEALLFVPDLDGAEAEIGGSGQMEAANATMIDSENVLLLRPISQPKHDDSRRAVRESTVNPPGFLTITVYRSVT